MFSLSYATLLLLLVSVMLVFMMSASLLKVVSIIGAHNAILLAFVTQGDTYCD